MIEVLPKEKQTGDCSPWKVSSYGLKSQQWYLCLDCLYLILCLDSHDTCSISIVTTAFCFIFYSVISNYFLPFSCSVFLSTILLSPFHSFLLLCYLSVMISSRSSTLKCWYISADESHVNFSDSIAFKQWYKFLQEYYALFLIQIQAAFYLSEN